MPGVYMSKQSNGWQAKTLKASRNQRINRAKQAAQLKRERVQGDEHTPAELHRDPRRPQSRFLRPQSGEEAMTRIRTLAAVLIVTSPLWAHVADAVARSSWG